MDKIIDPLIAFNKTGETEFCILCDEKQEVIYERGLNGKSYSVCAECLYQAPRGKLHDLSHLAIYDSDKDIDLIQRKNTDILPDVQRINLPKIAFCPQCNRRRECTQDIILDEIWYKCSTCKYVNYKLYFIDSCEEPEFTITQAPPLKNVNLEEKNIKQKIDPEFTISDITIGDLQDSDFPFSDL